MEFKFERLIPASIDLTERRIKQTLLTVQDQLLRNKFTSADKDAEAERTFDMDQICEGTRHDSDGHPCGTAACIGGWCGLIMLGVDPTKLDVDHGTVDDLMHAMINVNGSGDSRDQRLADLFFSYDSTDNYNHPQVAATAIQRYLDGNDRPWPDGEMPNLLPYRD